MHSIECISCENMVEIKELPQHYDVLECICGCKVLIDRGKNKYEITHYDHDDEIIEMNTHFINKKVAQ